jgi:hypothetical protein
MPKFTSDSALKAGDDGGYLHVEAGEEDATGFGFDVEGGSVQSMKKGSKGKKNGKATEMTAFENPMYDGTAEDGPAKGRKLGSGGYSSRASMKREARQIAEDVNQKEESLAWYQVRDSKKNPTRQFMLNATSVHGLNRIPVGHMGCRVLWTTLVLTSLVSAIYFINALTVQYLDYPTSTSVGINADATATFPNITLCNGNMFSSGKLMYLYPEYFDAETQIKMFRPETLPLRTDSTGTAGAVNSSSRIVSSMGVPILEWERVERRMKREMPKRQDALVMGVEQNFIAAFDYMS